MITLPFHSFSKKAQALRQEKSDSRETRRTDITWGRTLFQAPVLVTQQLRQEDLRFEEDFRPKLWMKRSA